MDDTAVSLSHSALVAVPLCSSRFISSWYLFCPTILPSHGHLLYDSAVTDWSTKTDREKTYPPCLCLVRLVGEQVVERRRKLGWREEGCLGSASQLCPAAIVDF